MTPQSDVDVIVVVDNEIGQHWIGSRSTALDVAIYSLADLAAPAMPRIDLDSWWNRYAFTHSRVLFDRLDGRIQELITRQGTLTVAESRALGADYLDGYLNFAVRSLKSARDGRPIESRLDAAESISYCLVVIFALENRVRPYNKYLPWELTHHPLINKTFEESTLLGLLAGILEGDVLAQRTLFVMVANAARGNGLGAVVDSWGDDLELFRSPE